MLIIQIAERTPRAFTRWRKWVMSWVKGPHVVWTSTSPNISLPGKKTMANKWHKATNTGNRDGNNDVSIQPREEKKTTIPTIAINVKHIQPIHTFIRYFSVQWRKNVNGTIHLSWLHLIQKISNVESGRWTKCAQFLFNSLMCSYSFLLLLFVIQWT